MMGKTPLERTWGDGFGDLIEAFLDVGNGEDVAEVADFKGFAEVNAEFVIVGAVEGGDAADALRPKRVPLR